MTKFFFFPTPAQNPPSRNVTHARHCHDRLIKSIFNQPIFSVSVHIPFKMAASNNKSRRKRLKKVFSALLNILFSLSLSSSHLMKGLLWYQFFFPYTGVWRKYWHSVWGGAAADRWWECHWPLHHCRWRAPSRQYRCGAGTYIYIYVCVCVYEYVCMCVKVPMI